MSGIINKDISSLNLKEKLDINKQLKNSQNLKFIVALILSNLTIFLLSFNSNRPTIIKAKVHTPAEGFSTISIEAESFLSDNRSQPITIISKNHQIISKDAILVELKNNRYQIDIKNEDLIKVPHNEEEKLIIIPKIKNAIINKVLVNKKDQYEITF